MSAKRFKPFNPAGICESCGCYASKASSGIDANGECIMCRRARVNREQQAKTLSDG